MNRLPGGMQRTLTALSSSLPFALFVRHGEREPIPPDDPYRDVDLTPLGMESAGELGRSLPSRAGWLATSPFLRCRRTARIIGGGGTRCVIESDIRLGSPGPWVTDVEAGARLFSELGAEGVVHAQITGRQWPFIRPLAEGTKLLLESALERFAAGRGSGVCVSHDAVLMPALGALVGERFEGEWLAPLDGFALQWENDALWVLWRGERREVVGW